MEQLHITHRAAYLRGVNGGRLDALAGAGYQARDGVGGIDDQRAYGLGYEAGWDAANPCSNGTCDHLAHHAAS